MDTAMDGQHFLSVPKPRQGAASAAAAAKATATATMVAVAVSESHGKPAVQWNEVENRFRHENFVYCLVSSLRFVWEIWEVW